MGRINFVKWIPGNDLAGRIKAETDSIPERIHVQIPKRTSRKSDVTLNIVKQKKKAEEELDTDIRVTGYFGIFDYRKVP